MHFLRGHEPVILSVLSLLHQSGLCFSSSYRVLIHQPWPQSAAAT